MSERRYPYLSALKSFELFVEEVKKSTPSEVTSTWIKDKNIAKGRNADQIVNALKRLGIVGADGKIADKMAAAFRVGGDTYADAMKEIVQSVYGDLIEQIKERADFTAEELKKHFAESMPKLGDVGLGKVRSTFVFLVKEANLQEITPESWAPTSVRKKAPERKRKAAPRRRKREKGLPERDVVSAILDKLPQVQINGTWDEERINLVFDRMEKLVDRIGRIMAEGE